MQVVNMALRGDPVDITNLPTGAGYSRGLWLILSTGSEPSGMLAEQELTGPFLAVPRGYDPGTFIPIYISSLVSLG